MDFIKKELKMIWNWIMTKLLDRLNKVENDSVCNHDIIKIIMELKNEVKELKYEIRNLYKINNSDNIIIQDSIVNKKSISKSKKEKFFIPDIETANFGTSNKDIKTKVIEDSNLDFDIPGE